MHDEDMATEESDDSDSEEDIVEIEGMRDLNEMLASVKAAPDDLPPPGAAHGMDLAEFPVLTVEVEVGDAITLMGRVKNVIESVIVIQVRTPLEELPRVT